MRGVLEHMDKNMRNERFWIGAKPAKQKTKSTVTTADKSDKTVITYNEDDKTHSIYLTDYITGPEDYTNVFDTMLNATEDETLFFILVTGGGRLDTTNKIRGLAQITKARTVALVGDVASAGTILALSFDDIIVMPNIEFMIHNYSGGVGGKAHEIYTHSAFLQKEMPKAFRAYYKDFLTEEELINVLAGQDLYLNSEEVEERWDRVLKARDAENLALQKESQAEQNEVFKQILEDNGYVVQLKDMPTPKGTAKGKSKPKATTYKHDDEDYKF